MQITERKYLCGNTFGAVFSHLSVRDEQQLPRLEATVEVPEVQCRNAIDAGSKTSLAPINSHSKSINFSLQIKFCPWVIMVSIPKFRASIKCAGGHFGIIGSLIRFYVNDDEI